MLFRRFRKNQKQTYNDVTGGVEGYTEHISGTGDDADVCHVHQRMKLSYTEALALTLELKNTTYNSSSISSINWRMETKIGTQGQNYQ